VSVFDQRRPVHPLGWEWLGQSLRNARERWRNQSFLTGVRACECPQVGVPLLWREGEGRGRAGAHLSLIAGEVSRMKKNRRKILPPQETFPKRNVTGGEKEEENPARGLHAGLGETAPPRKKTDQGSSNRTSHHNRSARGKSIMEGRGAKQFGAPSRCRAAGSLDSEEGRIQREAGPQGIKARGLEQIRLIC